MRVAVPERCALACGCRLTFSMPQSHSPKEILNPRACAGAATPQPPPGPDTRWTTLAQLIPGIAQTGAALGRASSGVLAGSSAPVLMEVRCQPGAQLCVPGVRVSAGSTAPALVEADFEA